MKTVLREGLNQTLELAKKYELKTIESDIDILEKESNDFKLKVIFIGSFSAGKSALVNAMIKQELLEEGQRPETAIASELVYSDKNYIEVMKDGKCVETYNINEAEKININKADYLLWHLNNDVLRDLDNCILVDFPGFNSGISAHNKAITQYAGKGNAYIFVIDCEEGTIKQSISELVEEIQNYDDNMAIVVSKTDLKSEEDVENVLENIKSTAGYMFGNDISITATNKFDPEVTNKMKNLLGEFDQKKIFKQSFFPRGYELVFKCKDSIEVYRDSLDLDLSDFDREIEKHEESKKRLGEQFNKDKAKLEKQLRTQVAPAVISDVRDALYSNVDSLARALKSGDNAFSMTVNNIIRPVLMTSTNNYIESSFEDFLNGINIELGGSDIDASVQEISAEAIEKYQKATNIIQEIANNADKFNAAYKTITTTLAVATSVIAPWLELVLIFLPDILKLFGGQNDEASLRNRVNDEIIPQLLRKIEPEIEKSLVGMKDEMIEALTENINELLDAEKEALEKAKEKKEEKREAFNVGVEKVNDDLKILEEIGERLIQ